MKRLNNKGFAVSTILYGILALIIIILMLVFGIMKASKDMNQDFVSSIEENMNNCVLNEVNLENCYFSNGVCDVSEYYGCIDKEFYSYLYGDVNEDGEVTNEDYHYLHYHINFPSANPLTERGKVNADVNLDGELTLDAPVIILCYLEGEEGYETLPYKG